MAIKMRPLKRKIINKWKRKSPDDNPFFWQAMWRRMSYLNKEYKDSNELMLLETITSMR